MKKTILLGLLFFAGGNLMAQVQPAGGSQIKVRTIKPPRPEVPDRGGEGTTTQPVKTTKPATPATTIKPAKETETKNKAQEQKEKKLPERLNLDLE